MLLDTDGYAIPFAADDAVIESEALCNGPPCSEDPAEWPEWTDQERWEPTDDDEAWWVTQNDDEDWQVDAQEEARWSQRLKELIEAFEPSDQDWDDFARWSGALTDEDIMAAGLSVG
jgi:hypothetical protein